MRIVLLFLLIPLCLCGLIPEFSVKSLYFTTLTASNPPSASPKHRLNEKSHLTDMLIIKYDKSHQSSTQTLNTISLYINSLYYRSLICLDPSDSNTFYTLKNRVLKHVSTFNYKNSDSYAEVGNCLEREEYIDKSLGLEEKNSLLESNYFYNLVHTGVMSKTKPPLIEKLTNVSFSALQSSIKEEFAKVHQWNDDCSYELSFSYDSSKELFALTHVFVYFLPASPEEFEELPLLLRSFHLGNEFEQVIMDDKANGTMTLFKKNNNEIEAKTDKAGISALSGSLKITTNKSTSVFHNTMSIHFSKEIVSNYYKRLGVQLPKEPLCYLIHEVLTEDCYIEKNEFRHAIDDYLSVPYELHASQFIEQELSSDLSQQAFFSFYFCANEDILKSINYTISFPIHFRYQPSVKADSSLTHQTVMMPAPSLLISKNMPYETALYNGFSIRFSSSKPISFLSEITSKQELLISKYHLLTVNHQSLTHHIPAGQMKYFASIAKLTSFASAAGFLIILYGLFSYIAFRHPLHKPKQQ